MYVGHSTNLTKNGIVQKNLDPFSFILEFKQHFSIQEQKKGVGTNRQVQFYTKLKLTRLMTLLKAYKSKITGRTARSNMKVSIFRGKKQSANFHPGHFHRFLQFKTITNRYICLGLASLAALSKRTILQVIYVILPKLKKQKETDKIYFNTIS